MSEGTQPQKLLEADRRLVEICKELNVNFTTRLHILLWGNKRGV